MTERENGPFSGFEASEDGVARRRNPDGSDEVIGLRDFMNALVAAVNGDGHMRVPVTRLESPTLRESLLYGLPSCPVAAGAVCVRAELEIINGAYIRPDRPPELDVEPRDGGVYSCAFASDRFSDICSAEVTNGLDGTVDTGSHGCMKERQIDADLAELRDLG